jgi:hypothetical protein
MDWGKLQQDIKNLINAETKRQWNIVNDLNTTPTTSASYLTSTASLPYEVMAVLISTEENNQAPVKDLVLFALLDKILQVTKNNQICDLDTLRGAILQVELRLEVAERTTLSEQQVERLVRLAGMPPS